MKLLLIKLIFSFQVLVLELLVTVRALMYGAAVRTVPDAERINFLDFHLSVSLLKHRGYEIIYSTGSEALFFQLVRISVLLLFGRWHWISCTVCWNHLMPKVFHWYFQVHVWHVQQLTHCN